MLSPEQAVEAIIRRGCDPSQFVSRAFQDKSQEWAVEFERIAFENYFFLGCFEVELGERSSHKSVRFPGIENNIVPVSR